MFPIQNYFYNITLTERGTNWNKINLFKFILFSATKNYYFTTFLRILGVGNCYGTGNTSYKNVWTVNQTIDRSYQIKYKEECASFYH